MNIKSLTIGALVGVSMLFGSVNLSASPVNTDSVSPYANPNVILRLGEVYNFHGTVSILYNPQHAIVVELGQYVKGIYPGQATVRVYSNGKYTDYDVFVKAN